MPDEGPKDRGLRILPHKDIFQAPCGSSYLPSLPPFTPLKGFARAARRLQHSAFPASSGLVLKLPSAGRPPFLPPMWFGFLRYTPCTLCTSPILHLSHSIVVTGLRAVFKSSR